MPGLGKSGTFLMAASISETAGVSWVMRVDELGSSGFHLLDHFAQFLQSNILDLAHTFPRDTELLPHFLQRLLRSPVQAEPGSQDCRFTRVQRFHHFLQTTSDGLLLRLR